MAEMLAQGKKPEVLFCIVCRKLMIGQKNNESCTNFKSYKCFFAVPKKAEKIEIRKKELKMICFKRQDDEY
jgi:hypothetical protein